MSRYDLFKVREGAPPLWFGTAETMEEAQRKVSQQSDCPECVLLDSETGERIVVKLGERAER